MRYFLKTIIEIIIDRAARVKKIMVVLPCLSTIIIEPYVGWMVFFINNLFYPSQEKIDVAACNVKSNQV